MDSVDQGRQQKVGLVYKKTTQGYCAGLKSCADFETGCIGIQPKFKGI